MGSRFAATISTSTNAPAGMWVPPSRTSFTALRNRLVTGGAHRSDSSIVRPSVSGSSRHAFCSSLSRAISASNSMVARDVVSTAASRSNRRMATASEASVGRPWRILEPDRPSRDITRASNSSSSFLAAARASPGSTAAKSTSRNHRARSTALLGDSPSNAAMTRGGKTRAKEEARSI